MKVERVSGDLDTPFVTITLTRKEAGILKRLVQYNIEEYKNCFGDYIMAVVLGEPNEDFATPLFEKLQDLGV